MKYYILISLFPLFAACSASVVDGSGVPEPDDLIVEAPARPAAPSATVDAPDVPLAPPEAASVRCGGCASCTLFAPGDGHCCAGRCELGAFVCVETDAEGFSVTCHVDL